MAMDVFLRLIALIFTAVSSATYIIDNTNTTVQYSGSTAVSLSAPGGLGWQIGTNSTYYNGTVTWNVCGTADNCHIKFPFTGSGITIYMVQDFASNFSVSIDGSTPMSFSFPEGGPLDKPNVTAYDKQALQSGDHNLDLMLLDTTDTPTYPGSTGSEFSFDYAVVNETNAFPSTSPAFISSTALALTQTPTLPVHYTSSSGHSAVTAAAVGGTIGGIAVIVAGLLIFVWILKATRSQPHPGEFDSEHKISTSNDYPVERPVVPSLPSGTLSTPATLVTAWQPAQSAVSSDFEKPDSTSASTPRDVAQYSSALASTSTNPLPEEQAALLLRLCSFGLSSSDITRLIGILNGRNESTVEDMQFLQRLYMLNVPADDVNLVVAAMRRRGQKREATYHSSYDGPDTAQFPVLPPLPEL